MCHSAKFRPWKTLQFGRDDGLERDDRDDYLDSHLHFDDSWCLRPNPATSSNSWCLLGGGGRVLLDVEGSLW